MRRTIGIAAFVLALTVLAVLLLALRQGVRISLPAISSWRHVTFGAPGSLYHGAGSAPAQGIRQVSVQAPTVGSVQVTTSPGSRVTWHWTVARAHQGVMSSAVAGGVLTLTFAPPASVQWNIGAMPDVLNVNVPPGLTANVSVTTGGATLSGTYRAVTANVTTGPLSIRDFRGRLSGGVVTGPLNAQAIEAEGPLRLEVGTGPLNFSGDPGLDSSFSVGTGPLNLALSPRGSLAVEAAAHLGPMNSGFPTLSGGTNGVFSGTIGQGPSGTLTVEDGTGPVSITPQ